ncbi:hypothetical protein RSOLAG1IB_08459 [Rhizoctonia solani AG-1 IB]|uniref:Uncharacterized protein n=1 Tax=Thanatephorus cucumeris (strain AG1-IB / isolate 7/3/14) TaxID=1108050 RepID=A0A0B7FM50_THACB|nr:hypothetical protein RSOLAG1IB_08459 [Rhizoctonia solani AG-1 IB]
MIGSKLTSRLYNANVVHQSVFLVGPQPCPCSAYYANIHLTLHIEQELLTCDKTIDRGVALGQANHQAQRVVFSQTPTHIDLGS